MDQRSLFEYSNYHTVFPKQWNFTGIKNLVVLENVQIIRCIQMLTLSDNY